METTIQVSRDLREALHKRKFAAKESYEEVIWDLIEDSMEISEETKKEIGEAREEFSKGKVKPLSQVKRNLGL